MTVNVTLQDVVPSFAPGDWDTPAGTKRLYRIDVAVFTDEEPPGVNVTLQLTAGVISGTFELKAWRTGPPTAYSYQVGTGNLVVHNVDLNGQLVSAFVEITTDAGVLPTTAQSANITITPVGGSPAIAPLSGHVLPPLDERAAVSIILDQTMGDPSIDVLGPAQDAAKLMLDFLRPEDWANVWYIQPFDKPLLPSSTALIRDLTPAFKTKLKGYITNMPTRPAGEVRANIALNTVGGGLKSMMSSCVCAPPTKACVLFSCVSAGNTGPVSPQNSVSLYSVWLGTPPTSPPAGAYTAFNLLNPTNTTELFLLRKYLLQIVAGSTGFETIFDPDGSLQGNQQAEIAFDVNDADSDVRVLVLADTPELIELELKADDYHVVPGRTAGAFRRQVDGFVEMRVARDLERPRHQGGCGCGGAVVQPQKPHGDALPGPKSGKWKAVVSLNRKALESGEQLPRVPFSVVVFARSELKFTASVHQDRESIGGAAFISAQLHDSGVPVTGDRARVVAQVTFPDGGKAKVPLRETSEGRYEARVTMTQPGLTRFRIMASGQRIPEGRFQRELSFTTVTRSERECYPKRERHHDDACAAAEGQQFTADDQGASEPTERGLERHSREPGPKAAASKGGPDGRSLVQRLINAVTAELLR